MILCDTNILIEFYKGNPQIVQKLRQIGAGNIAVSVVTHAELFYGAKDKQEFASIERHLQSCAHFPINAEISKLFLDLMRRYSLSHRVTIADMLIAATALHHNCPLFTLNTKDFRFIDGLKRFEAER
jgi:tRNA(fMet)-specific endonuclease VapC